MSPCPFPTTITITPRDLLIVSNEDETSYDISNDKNSISKPNTIEEARRIYQP